jgi:hypothetical protein
MVAPLDYWALWGLFSHLWHIFWGNAGVLPSGGIYYVVFMLLIPYTLYRANQRASLITLPNGKLMFRLSAISLCFIFYFLSVVTFALRVYPFVPVSKGGGDFSEGPCIAWNNGVSGTNLLSTSWYFAANGLAASNCFVVIEETSDVLFLANTNDANGPTMWREMRQLPTVVEVKRDTAYPIVYRQK